MLDQNQLIDRLKRHFPACTKLFDQTVEKLASEAEYQQKYAAQLAKQRQEKLQVIS